MLHLNTRSMFKKREELFEVLDGCDIATFSETWFNTQLEDDLLAWTGMKLFRLDRNKKKGGGIAVYIKQSLSAHVSVINTQCRGNRHVECLVLDIILPNCKTIRVATLYRPPSGKNKLFLEHLEVVLKDAWTNDLELWCMGHLNINTLSERAGSSIKLTDLCKFYGFHKLINQCTRPYKRRASCIDNVLTNYRHDIFSGVLNLLVSDHLPVFAVKTKLKVVYEEKVIVSRSYKKFDEDLFLDWLIEADWGEFYDIEDPSDAWIFIENHINMYLDGVCPLVKRIFKDRGNTWMTPDILSLIHEREDYVELFYRTGLDCHLEHVKFLRRRINVSVRYAKANEIKQALEDNRDNPKAFWRTINNIVKPSAPVEPPTLIGDDDTLKSNQDSVDYLNQYFANIGSVLAGAMGPTVDGPDAPDGPARHGDVEVTEGLVELLFKELNVNKTSGIEHVRSDILKLAMVNLVPQMTWLYKSSFSKGVVPETWKVARVNPIPKEGNLKQITNWRPISLLSAPSKICEKLMHIHM